MSEPHDNLLPDIEPAHIRAVFFDLDGTLLPMDLDEFIQSYFGAIGAYVKGQGLDVDAFSAGFARGMRKMAHHDPAITNWQAFWNEFFQWADAEAYDWQTILLRFYSEEFPLVGKDVVPNPASARVVQLLVEKGYPVVLATMPYFPLPAVEERLGAPVLWKEVLWDGLLGSPDSFGTMWWSFPPATRSMPTPWSFRVRSMPMKR